MTKIMLVEDDKSLREIYGVRLDAEGYEIVSAGDGEEALAMAIKERPQLIISDVMMPKVSGYDMLDILRSTTETKNIRVIMMTALSSEEQRARAESLGADRYLVKSQVGIEDVVRVVHEILEDAPGAAQTTPAPTATPVVSTTPQPAMTSTPAPAPTTAPAPVATVAVPAPITPIQAVPAPMPAPVVTPVVIPAPAPVTTPTPMPSMTPSPSPAPSTPVAPVPTMQMPTMPKTSDTPKPASLKTRIIQPLNDPSISPVNINDLLDKELAKEAGLTDIERPAVESINQERAEVAAQLQSFTPPEPTPVASPVDAMSAPAAPAVPSLLPTPGLGAQPAQSAPVVPTTPVVTPPSTPEPAPTPTPVTPVSVTPAVQPVAPVLAPQPTPAPAAPSPQAAATPSVGPASPATVLPEVPQV